MKCWIVVCDEGYNGMNIEKVFISQEKAKSYKESLEKEQPLDYGDYVVYEFEVNE